MASGAQASMGFTETVNRHAKGSRALASAFPAFALAW
jgi:hypothetical protein